jgi:hypothetical protein
MSTAVWLALMLLLIWVCQTRPPRSHPLPA